MRAAVTTTDYLFCFLFLVEVNELVSLSIADSLNHALDHVTHRFRRITPERGRVREGVYPSLRWAGGGIA